MTCMTVVDHAEKGKEVSGCAKRMRGAKDSGSNA
jgi:hypothetical protein